jgi:mRNA interferase MazF
MALIRRGDIWLVNYRPDGRTGEAGQIHPGVIVTNNNVNFSTEVLMVVPITSSVDRLFITDVLLPNQRSGLDKDSKAQIEATRAVHVSRLIKSLGFVPADLMLEIDEKLRIHLAL